MQARRLGILAIIGLVAVMLAGLTMACSDDDDNGGEATATSEATSQATEATTPTTPEGTAVPTGTQTSGESALCSDIASLQTADAALDEALSNSNSTVGDIRAANDAVNTAYASLQASATAVQGERVAAIDSAQTDLQAAMTALPDTATRDEALTAIQPSAQALAAAITSSLSSLGC